MASAEYAAYLTLRERRKFRRGYAAFLAECARLVKPGGAVAIIEWRHDVDLEIRADHRIAVPVIAAHATAAGLDRHEVQVLDDARVLVRLTRGIP